MNASIYVFRRKFFELKFRTQITDRSLIYKMDHICFEIDNPIEMEFLDFLIKKDYTKNTVKKKFMKMINSFKLIEAYKKIEINNGK